MDGGLLGYVFRKDLELLLKFAAVEEEAGTGEWAGSELKDFI